MKLLVCLVLCFAAAAHAGLVGVPGAVTYSAGVAPVASVYGAPLAYSSLGAPLVRSAYAAPAVYAAPAAYAAPLSYAAPVSYAAPAVYSTLLKK